MLLFHVLAVILLARMPVAYTKCFEDDPNRVNKWSNYEVSMATANTFCDEAERSGWVNDKGGFVIQRRYNHVTVDQMDLSMSYRPGQKPTKDYCVKGFQTILDKCDQWSKTNPLKWARGGEFTGIEQGTGKDAFVADFYLSPERKRYTPGCCYLDLVEAKIWKKRDVYEHFIEGFLFDGHKDKTTSIDRTRSEDGRPAIMKGLYVDLEITAEERGDYVQFAIGGERWPSNQKNMHASSCEKDHCDVNRWLSSRRGIKCWFDC